MEDKYLYLEIEEDSYAYTIRIQYQSHRSDWFSPKPMSGDGTFFEASNGFLLASRSHPEINLLNNILYVKGANTVLDNEGLYIVKVEGKSMDAYKTRYIESLVKAVAEYNGYMERISIKKGI